MVSVRAPFTFNPLSCVVNHRGIDGEMLHIAQGNRFRVNFVSLFSFHLSLPFFIANENN
jgi:hypothetical protein